MIVWRVKGRLCSMQYCVRQLCTVQCTHMARPNSCLLVRFSFSVVILYVTVYLCICIRFSLLGLFCVIVYLCMCAFVALDLVSSVLCQEIG